VFEHLRRNDAMKRPGIERQLEGIPDYTRTLAAARCDCIVVRSKAPHHPGSVFHLGRVSIQGRDDRTPAHRFECVPPGARSEVEQAVAWSHPEAVVANRQHLQAEAPSAARAL
jgi:hypothetical protein